MEKREAQLPDGRWPRWARHAIFSPHEERPLPFSSYENILNWIRRLKLLRGQIARVTFNSFVALKQRTTAGERAEWTV